MNKILLLFFTCVFFKNVICANILYIAAVPSPSHDIWNRVLGFALSKNGHNVTMLGNDKFKDQPSANFHLLKLNGIYEHIEKEEDMTELISTNPFLNIKNIFNYGLMYPNLNYKTEGFKRLLQYPRDKFDLIVYDVTLSQHFYPIIDYFGKPPVVGVSPFSIPPYLSLFMGNHLSTSFYPHNYLRKQNRMDFLDRMYNYLVSIVDILMRKYSYVPKLEKIAREYFKNSRSLEDIERDIKIVLVNSDPIYDYPLPIPPNIIQVGGLQIQEPKPLPKDLQDIMDNSKHGIIFFSLGTNLRSDTLDVKLRNLFLNAFSKIKETVIWKFESELEGLPKNVFIKKWLPQNDILAHPKTVLFISHGGGLSTQESLYHGVPMLMLPCFADQLSNAQKIIEKKVGLKEDISKMSEEGFSKILSELLNNPEYRNNMKKLSAKYRDRPQKPLNAALFWIDYMLRHGDTNHLDMPSRDMNYFQIENLDVIGFIAACVVFALWIDLKIISFVLRKKCKSKKIKKQ